MALEGKSGRNCIGQGTRFKEKIYYLFASFKSQDTNFLGMKGSFLIPGYFSIIGNTHLLPIFNFLSING
ncbi:MAG: hypothetical protein DWQ02_28360 [Bacteroidetes bacterium]|nr:MAG: hypothetical protein DWQ02_28360 [Bacteroidota bacterium]